MVKYRYMLNEAYKEYPADKELFDALDNRTIGRQALIPIAEDAARYRADTVLLENIQPLPLSGEDSRKVHDRFITKTGSAWVPASRFELDIADTGLVKALETVSSFSHKGDPSIMKRYGAANSFERNAAASLSVMLEARSGAVVDVAFLRANPEIIIQMANFFVDRSHLEDYGWQEDENQGRVYTEQDVESLKVWQRYLEYASDPVLLKAYGVVLDAYTCEYEFWKKEIDQAVTHKIMKRVAKLQSLPPRAADPRLEREITATDKLIALTLSDRVWDMPNENETSPNGQGESQFEQMLPPGAQKPLPGVSIEFPDQKPVAPPRLKKVEKPEGVQSLFGVEETSKPKLKSKPARRYDRRNLGPLGKMMADNDGEPGDPYNPVR